MPKRVAFVVAEIDRHIAAAVAPDSPNRMAAHELRELARGYLARVDREDDEFPGDADLPHWNLWMRDRRLDDALFVALIFRRGGVEFVCGSGYAFDIRRACEGDGVNPETLFAVMSQHFPATQPPLPIERPAAALWLGRGWKP